MVPLAAPVGIFFPAETKERGATDHERYIRRSESQCFRAHARHWHSRGCQNTIRSCRQNKPAKLPAEFISLVKGYPRGWKPYVVHEWIWSFYNDEGN